MSPETLTIPFVQQPAYAHGHPHYPIHYSAHGSAMPHELAWPGQTMHNPFCHQHGKPAEVEPACGCSQHFNNAAVPPTVPTPPPSDGSPHPRWVSNAMAPPEADDGLSKRLRIDWSFEQQNTVLRPDGAKFEIPDDRNLDNLDQLIKHATSEGELKELKMQKRLLRNREAALHSRQKKKSHTEWLERERDDLSTRLYHQQHELTNLRIRVDDNERDRSEWQEQLTKAQQKATAVQREKEMLQEQHARETQKLLYELEHLRSLLQDQDQRQNPLASPTSTAPNSATFSSDDSVNFSNIGHDTDWEGGGYEFITDHTLVH